MLYMHISFKLTLLISLGLDITLYGINRFTSKQQ